MRIDLRGKPASELSPGELAGVLPRAELDVDAALAAVRPIIEDVRRRGADAVREHTAHFDGVDLATSRVPRSALAAALAGLDPAVRAALEECARRARLVHEAQVPPDSVTTVAPGSTVTERYVPVRRAGVYAPGGLVTYPSSVVMNVIPAQVAGVDEIAVVSPPQADQGGLPAAAVLAACELLGITEVHAAGGAQAMAMLAYGTADCAAVDVISGPGNVYVAAASTGVTRSASAGSVVISRQPARGSCSAWATRSATRKAGSAVSSAMMAISVGPASASTATWPLSRRLAAAT